MSDQHAGAGESTLTVLVALLANALIAVAKFVAAALTGSSAMLSEAFHSLADTGNEVLLLVAQRRSARPPDPAHPLGHGREAYVWALVAAISVFVAGAVVAVHEGIDELLSPTGVEAYGVAYAVLGVSLALELTSLLRARQQLRREAAERHRDLLEHVMATSDPTTRAVFAEDSAAVLGDLVALAGVGLHQATGSAVPDAVASLVIGGILASVAWVLGSRNIDFLVGEPVGADMVAGVRHLVLDQPGVVEVRDLTMTFVGPGRVAITVRLDVDDDLRGDDVEALVRRVEAALRRSSPAVERADVVPVG